MRLKASCSLVLTYILVVAAVVTPFSLSALAKPKFKMLATVTGGLWSGLTLDSKGNLFGATNAGGQYGHGSIYEVAHNPNGTWTATTLYSFNGSDGALPRGGLIFDANGNMYGVTSGGGAYYNGTVFELSLNDGVWNLSTLFSFCEQYGCSDGSSPSAGMVQDEDGNLYGTANGGLYGLGVVFELSPGLDGWTESVLYTFGSRPDDATASDAPLMFDGPGLYGASLGGGLYNDGTIFRLQKRADGWKERLSWQFDSKDGADPLGALVFDSKGNLYGATNGGEACVFELVPKANGGWKEIVLHRFQNHANGFAPATGLARSPAGTLYGTTALGGNGQCYDGCGVVYQLASVAPDKWEYKVLYEFVSTSQSPPDGQLVLDAKGNLYGTAFSLVYEVTP